MAAHLQNVRIGLFFMAKGNFGERLKRERELREVSMDELSKATRISNRFLQALENEDWEKLPGGVFGHGFVRSIARYLGLGEETLLAEYDLARTVRVSPSPPQPEERIPSPPKWIPAVALLVLLLLIVGLFFTARYGWRRFAAHRAPKRSSSSVTATQTQACAGSASPLTSYETSSPLLLKLNGRAMASLVVRARSVNWYIARRILR
jgi:cytoskeleton protein RodZ